jgi:hypothetical protein
MIALVFSALFTLYLLVPEAVFRLIFGFFIPSRTFVLTRTEKAYRAVLITILPFLLAWGLTWYAPVARSWPFPITENSVQQRRADYKEVSAAFYSDAEFTRQGKEFWHSLTRCSRRQARLVAWYILLVGLEALFIGLIAANYAKLKNRFLLWVSNSIFSAYISQWHPLLPIQKGSPIVQIDILCSDHTLYQGVLLEYFLKDGELSGIFLKDPFRFDRPAYLKAKEAAIEQGETKKVEVKNYWRKIPSRHLYFFADKILNMNFKYLAERTDPDAFEKYLEQAKPFKDVGKLTVEVPAPKKPSADTPKT